MQLVTQTEMLSTLAGCHAACHADLLLTKQIRHPNDPRLTSQTNLDFQQWCQQPTKQNDSSKKCCVESVVCFQRLLCDGWQEGQRTEVLLLLNLHTSRLVVTLACRNMCVV